MNHQVNPDTVGGTIPQYNPEFVDQVQIDTNTIPLVTQSAMQRYEQTEEVFVSPGTGLRTWNSLSLAVAQGLLLQDYAMITEVSTPRVRQDLRGFYLSTFPDFVDFTAKNQDLIRYFGNKSVQFLESLNERLFTL